MIISKQLIINTQDMHIYLYIHPKLVVMYTNKTRIKSENLIKPHKSAIIWKKFKVLIVLKVSRHALWTEITTIVNREHGLWLDLL